MLTFHKFPDRQKAEAFSSAIVVRFTLTAFLFDSQKDSDLMRRVPSKLTAPIVFVARGPDKATEGEIIDLAAEFEGEYVDT